MPENPGGRPKVLLWGRGYSSQPGRRNGIRRTTAWVAARRAATHAVFSLEQIGAAHQSWGGSAATRRTVTLARLPTVQVKSVRSHPSSSKRGRSVGCSTAIFATSQKNRCPFTSVNEIRGRRGRGGWGCPSRSDSGARQVQDCLNRLSQRGVRGGNVTVGMAPSAYRQSLRFGGLSCNSSDASCTLCGYYGCTKFRASICLRCSHPDVAI